MLGATDPGFCVLAIVPVRLQLLIFVLRVYDWRGIQNTASIHAEERVLT